MSLLRFHKILITAALALSLILTAWGVVHAVVRREPGTWVVLALGVVAGVAGSLYYRKLRKNPPIH